ncbi:MAG: hypothetical protein K0S12_1801, partial [Bacteroidetes bacterium]|nr:hypothetical protein [Bacteroidota bacterium]
MSNFEIIYIDDDIEDLDIFAEALNDLCESEQRKIGLMVFNSGNEVVPLLL